MPSIAAFQDSDDDSAQAGSGFGLKARWCRPAVRLDHFSSRSAIDKVEIAFE
jgi:hypothetical protein